MLAEQSADHVVILVDAEGLILWWNEQAERTFGLAHEDIHGHPISRFFTEEDIERGTPEHEMAVARAHGAAEDDRWMARADGSTFWATGTMNVLRDSRGEVVGFGKVLRNRTDLKEQMETLRNQVVAMNDTHRQKDVFFTTLAHELRNPLSPLGNAVAIIRKSSSPLPEVVSSLDIIDRQIETLQRLVDDLMDVSRIHAGKIELKKEPISVHEVIHGALQSVGPLIRERRHALDVLLPPKPIVIEGDRVRLEQVFVNLLNNAAKYTPEHGKIWVSGTTEGNEAVVRVADSGVGIPHDVLPRIFDLFTQAESSRDHARGGLGIGLSLVKSLVSLHGGSVQVRSDGEGKGSEFIVRIPFRSPVPVPA